MSRRSSKIEFVGSQGVPLVARLDLPQGTPWAYAVFAPCFTCGKDWLAAARICRGLAERGIAVLSVDFTGIGESGGDFADSTFSSDVDDLVRAADHLRENFAAASLLIGHSLGGAAVLAAAHRIPETAAVATIGAPAEPEHVVHTFGGKRERPADPRRSRAPQVLCRDRWRRPSAHRSCRRPLCRDAAGRMGRPLRARFGPGRAGVTEFAYSEPIGLPCAECAVCRIIQTL
ncbi:alpha/beta hydrolase family protein [Streptomyces spiralis]|uniref:alpha/beta hydrolase family protein n=1 Tax=Streptomyces spiralis TaxID=66376 RepID=UPI0033F0F4EE